MFVGYKISQIMNNFYIYEHIRNDNNLPFYVGKGKNNRANQKISRNKYWHHVVNKSNGFKVNYIKKDIDEELAFLCEIEAIDVYKRRGLKLVNLTLGGEGASGLSRVVSEEQKKAQSERMKGNQYFKGKKIPNNTKIAVIESNKRRKGIATGIANFAGKSHSEEHKLYMHEKMKNRQFSEETRIKMSIAQKKRWNKEKA